MDHTGTAQTGTASSSSKYIVQSSDVIQEGARLNVFDETGTKVIWYKERYLFEEEIVEHFVLNSPSTLLWTIHRPKRGWYIRLRSPVFPPGTYISLNPRQGGDGALGFMCRTTVRVGASGAGGGNEIENAQTSSQAQAPTSPVVHSYPPAPTPPPVPIHVQLQPPSPKSVQRELERISESEAASGSSTKTTTKRRPPPPTQITEFILSPSLAAPDEQVAAAGEAPKPFWSRALSLIRAHAPSPAGSNSFTLARAPPPRAPVPLGSPSTVALASDMSPNPHSHPHPSLHHRLHPPTPLLRFTDTTPVLTLRSLSGTIEIDHVQHRECGVDTAFWIAVALAYLEFLEERESYLAAMSD